MRRAARRTRGSAERGRRQREPFRLAAAERLDGGDGGLGDARVRVGEQREQRAHHGGDAHARQRVAGGGAHVGIGVAQALRDLARRRSRA